MESSETVVFLAMPRHKREIDALAAKRFYSQMTARPYGIAFLSVGSSLLARGFNTLWSTALNYAAQGKVTHFAMLHSDVAPEPYWLDKLIDLSTEHEADVLSVVIPLKGNEGTTSTGISYNDKTWEPEKRFTIREVCTFPEVFTATDIGYAGQPLLVNTGCWIADVRKPWCTAVDDSGCLKSFFTINDRVRWDDERNTWQPEVEPEDWFFSRSLHGAGCRVMATTAIKVEHVGDASYSNQGEWGVEVDPRTTSVQVE